MDDWSIADQSRALLIDAPSLMDAADERQLVVDYLAQVTEVERLRKFIRAKSMPRKIGR